ncbi:single-strand DNA-binding protein, partial [Tremellales sp. Uapishka_1]
MFSALRQVASLKTGVRSFSSTPRALDLSRVTLIGRLGSDPVLRETTSGKPYYTYTVATSVGAFGPEDADGNRAPPPTSWHTVFAFDDRSHKAISRVGKGSQVYVEAELEMRPSPAGADGPIPDRAMLRHQKINILSRVKPESELEVSEE